METLEQLVADFKKHSIIQVESILNSDYRKGNKAFDKMQSVCNKAIADPELRNKFLDALLAEDDFRVSLNAAGFCLQFNYRANKANEINKRLSVREDIGIISFIAESGLEEYRKKHISIKDKIVKEVSNNIMSIFNFKKTTTLPCQEGPCAYEYGMSDRDIEGMPFPKDESDKRSCPKYGHICPKFMKDFKLSPEDLAIRATIHCSVLANDNVESGEWVLENMENGDQIRDLLARGDQTIRKYPPKKFPKYYKF